MTVSKWRQSTEGNKSIPMCTVNRTGGNGPESEHGRFILYFTEKSPLEGIIKHHLPLETAESPPLETGTGTN